MFRVHFIAIGGAAMHNLAIALSQKDGYTVTGSDDIIFEPSLSRLKKHGLLPNKTGWFPEKITPNLSAVILGMHAKEDNPELLRAKELKLKIYSFPEYLYLQTRSKARIVIGGSHGKTSTTAMILHVFNKLNFNVDYMVGAQIEGFDNMVKLSHDARIAVFEGDEYLTSPLDSRPKFHLYQPHIAVLTGIAWDHINVFPTYEEYVEQFYKFVDLIELEGRFIYYDGDPELRKIAENIRRDIVPFPYGTPDHEIINGVTYLKTKKGNIPLKIFGKHNLQNLHAARLVCRQMGVSEDQFNEAIADFTGAFNRMQKIVETKDSVAFKDFAHSPSKLQATMEAVRDQYPERKIIACMELHTYSSLTDSFLPEYKNCMQKADIAMVYYDADVLKQKGLANLDENKVSEAFGGNNLKVYTDNQQLKKDLQSINYNNSALIFMSSGNFSGIKIEELAKTLLDKKDFDS